MSGCSRLASTQDGEKSWLERTRQPWETLATRMPVSMPREAPSHTRRWRADLMVLPYADVQAERVLLHHIRDCDYRTEEDYDVRHFDRPVQLRDVQSIDFIVVPFTEAPALAHTMLSFGLADGQHLVFSVEARLEQGEVYSMLGGTTNQYELMWVLGTERDLIRLRTKVRQVDVYLYPAKVTPEQAQRIFLAAVERMNQIAQKPEFYNVLNNNCTTNIVDMVNDLRPDTIPQDMRVVLPGHSDRMAYELGLLAAEGPWEQVKQASRINLSARLYEDSTDFSAAIRGLPH